MINEMSFDEKADLIWKIVAEDPKLIYNIMTNTVGIDDEIKEMRDNGISEFHAIKKVEEVYGLSMREAADFVVTIYNNKEE